MRRWCTRLKVDAINRYVRQLENPVSCIGFAADESHRDKNNNGKIPKRYPLIEYGVTEEEALSYCKKLGYDWGGGFTTGKTVFPAGVALCRESRVRGGCVSIALSCGGK